MIKAAIDRILELAVPNTLKINNDIYVDKKVSRINKEQRASAITMSTLSSLVRFIKDNPDDFKACDYIVQIMSPTKVRLVSELDSDREREILAEVEADIPVFRFGRFIDHEEFLIAVQSNFVEGPPEENDKDLILKFAGTVKTGSVTKYGDDGVSQKATIKTGVHSLSEAVVPSPCALKPYRTFVEVDQPISRFIFRMQEATGDSIMCALFEADGGAWKIQAQENIRLYLEEQLGEMDRLIIIS